ncbi:hypothetical protein DDZ14_07290 [Maritimibacter sp. 55A14]|uniref:DUF2059 domain-containing protein n=1 Tax=Maritimibacter sp. 55A14 TaxID=2174844 RepID=UPI000D610774|nr:DUF2059 domain-containing protein [Maritimibacter sp. 55A14]PWE33203.1 hypothetical protein DDZ14_07290 [Maritimibacter sp. 55A14]
MLRLFLLPFLLLLAGAVQAGPDAQESRLLKLMGTDELLDVMREEGMEHAAQLEEDYLEGDGGAVWRKVAADVYDPERLGGVFRDAFAGRLSEPALAASLEFFGTDLGQRVIALEISARSALRSPDIEAESASRVEDLRRDDGIRLDQIDRFVEINDLIESNVAGALNANFAFYRAMNEGGAFPYDLSESEMLGDVWSQEEEMRRETTDWIYSYLTLAYQPLGDDELERYIEFSATDAGQQLNRAIFEAFDVMYRDVSARLGKGLAGFIRSEKL